MQKHENGNQGEKIECPMLENTYIGIQAWISESLSDIIFHPFSPLTIVFLVRLNKIDA